MSDYGHVVAWQGIRAGRESKALELWADTLDFYEKAKANGKIDEYDIVLFEPSAGSLPLGLLTTWGSQDQIDAFVRDEDRIRLQGRAGLVVEGLTVSRCMRGQAVIDGVGNFTEILSSI